MLDDMGQAVCSAADRIIERVERGGDAVVRGAPEAVADVLAAAAEGLRARGEVILVSDAGGPLSLSLLIAALSGVEALDELDDGALSAGLQRVREASVREQAVMVLDVRRGMRRPAFRFLRRVVADAPELRLVMSAFGELPALLAEPGMLLLRQRLEAEPAIVAEAMAGAGAGVALARPAIALAPLGALDPAIVRWPGTLRGSGRARRGMGRSVVWSAAAVGMAACGVLGAVLGTASSGPAAHGRSIEMPITAARVPAPVRAAVAPVVAARASQPAGATAAAAPGTLAASAPIGTPQASAPVLAASGAPADVAAAPAEPATLQEPEAASLVKRRWPLRRPFVRTARTFPSWRPRVGAGPEDGAATPEGSPSYDGQAPYGAPSYYGRQGGYGVPSGPDQSDASAGYRAMPSEPYADSYYGGAPPWRSGRYRPPQSSDPEPGDYGSIPYDEGGYGGSRYRVAPGARAGRWPTFTETLPN